MKWILLAIMLTGCNEATQGGGVAATGAGSESQQSSAAPTSEGRAYMNWWVSDAATIDLRELTFAGQFNAKQGQDGTVCNVTMNAEMRGDTLVVETTAHSVHEYPLTHPELITPSDVQCAGGINGRYDLTVSEAGLRICVEGTNDCATMDQTWF